MAQDPESARLDEARTAKTPWRKWESLPQRAAVGVRFAKTTARTGMHGTTSRMTRLDLRAYHWGEDGMAGISDDKQLLWLGPGPCGTAKTPFSKNECSVGEQRSQ